MIAQQLHTILQQIRAAEYRYHRPIGAVSLLAVSKTKSAQLIAHAYQAGQRHFGENYVQEAISKQSALGAMAITWHFIGPIQANKTKLIAQHFNWVHSVDSLKIAARLSQQRPPQLPPLNVCLQVNISDEHSKSGIKLDQLAAFYDEVALLPGLKVRGVMAIPAPEIDLLKQRGPYQKLMQAVHDMNKPELDTFSFGMSGDMEAAIAEGSTIVRIGTALFGARG